MVQTRINFDRALVRFLKCVAPTSWKIVGLYLQQNGELKPKHETGTRSVPLLFTLSSQKWGIIQRMKWEEAMDCFPLQYYTQLEWFFRLVRQIRQAFMQLHGLYHRNGLPADLTQEEITMKIHKD